MLPGETDALAFGIANQPPENQQVNVLNIFDDGSQQDQTGTLSSTTLTGFGMGPGVDYSHHAGYCVPSPDNPTQCANGVAGTCIPDATLTSCLNHPTFGEPPIFPSGVSFGSITVNPVTNQILTNAALTSIQVLNLMMGQGNDHLLVTGSLVPGSYSNDDGTPCNNPDGTPCTFLQGGITTVNGGGASQLAVNDATFSIAATTTPNQYTILRADGDSWAASEYTLGQELTWNGTPFGTISAIGTGSNGDTLTVSGTPPSLNSGTCTPGTSTPVLTGCATGTPSPCSTPR